MTLVLIIVVTVALIAAVAITRALTRAVKQADVVIAAGKAPADSTEVAILRERQVSVHDRHGLLRTLETIRAMPEALGDHEHRNGRLL